MNDKKFDKIIKKLKEDSRNKSYTERGIPPIFQVSPKAQILIIGQAPGKKVEESLIPFNDKSGEKLVQWMGVDRDTFYSEKIAILPMDFIAKEYHKDILDLMPDIKLTILIGSYSMKYYLGKGMKENLTETVRSYKEYLPKYFPIVHPSPLNFRWQKANPWFEGEVVPVLRDMVEKILADR